MLETTRKMYEPNPAGKGKRRKLPDSWRVKDGDEIVFEGTKEQCAHYCEQRRLRKAEGGKP